jgi:hypothetical protein
MTDQKKHCVIIGLCFTTELAYLLRLSGGFRRDYVIAPYVHAIPCRDFMEDFNVTDEELDRTAVIIYPPVTWIGWEAGGHEEQKYLGLVARFPEHVKQITVPYPVFHPLWPFHATDPRLNSVNVGPLDDNNGLLYAYADGTVLTMRGQGKTPAQIVREYSSMDVSNMLDLDRFFEHIIAGQRLKEAQTGVKVVDFTLERFRDQQVFLSVNHGANLLMIHIVDQILAELGYPPLPRYAHEALCELMDPTIPIHPSISRYYNLAWAAPDTRYKIDRRRNLTWEEYIYQLAMDGN